MPLLEVKVADFVPQDDGIGVKIRWSYYRKCSWPSLATYHC